MTKPTTKGATRNPLLLQLCNTTLLKIKENDRLTRSPWRRTSHCDSKSFDPQCCPCRHPCHRWKCLLVLCWKNTNYKSTQSLIDNDGENNNKLSPKERMKQMKTQTLWIWQWTKSVSRHTMTTTPATYQTHLSGDQGYLICKTQNDRAKFVGAWFKWHCRFTKIVEPVGPRGGDKGLSSFELT